MVHGITIGELAIAMAYAMLDARDPLSVAWELTRGYQAVRSISERELEALSANMVLVATYWLSFDFARNPRRVQDGASLARGVYHVMALVSPFLSEHSRALFERLAHEYVVDNKE